MPWCRYHDCKEKNPVIPDEKEEEIQVTCSTCRRWMGLPALPDMEEVRITTDADIIARARARYVREGEIEIDEDAPVSRAEGNPDQGAYVQAWVWVADSIKDE